MPPGANFVKLTIHLCISVLSSRGGLCSGCFYSQTSALECTNIYMIRHGCHENDPREYIPTGKYFILNVIIRSLTCFYWYVDVNWRLLKLEHVLYALKV